jgi:MFS family permease
VPASQVTPQPSVLGDFFERNRFLLAFAVLSTLMGTSVGMAKVATSLYALELHASDSLLGLIAASQTVGVLLVSVPIGVLVDRYGPARPFVLGSFAAGSLYAALPLVPSAGFLLAGTTAISFFMPMRFVSLNTLFMRELVRIGLAKAGWYRGTHMVGMMLLGPVISVSIAQQFGFSGTYWLIAGLFGLTIVVSPIVFGRYADNGAADASGAESAQRKLSLAELRAQGAMIAREVELRRTCYVEFAAQSVNAFFTFFIVIIVVDTLHLERTRATELLGLEGGAFMVALFLFGHFVERLGEDRVYRLSFAVVTVALLLLGLRAEFLWLRLGSALLGLGLGTLQIVNLTRFAAIGGRLGRGKVSGITPLVGTAGSLLGSLLGGVLGQSIGLPRVFVVYAVAFCALIPLLRSRTARALLAEAK